MLTATLAYVETLIRTRSHRRASIDYLRSRWMAKRILAHSRARWSRHTGLCWQCKYDLRGCEGACSECGARFIGSAGDSR